MDDTTDTSVSENSWTIELLQIILKRLCDSVEGVKTRWYGYIKRFMRNLMILLLRVLISVFTNLFKGRGVLSEYKDSHGKGKNGRRCK